jgi:hypothetical protein
MAMAGAAILCQVCPLNSILSPKLLLLGERGRDREEKGGERKSESEGRGKGKIFGPKERGERFIVTFLRFARQRGEIALYFNKERVAYANYPQVIYYFFSFQFYIFYPHLLAAI